MNKGEGGRDIVSRDKLATRPLACDTAHGTRPCSACDTALGRLRYGAGGPRHGAQGNGHGACGTAFRGARVRAAILPAQATIRHGQAATRRWGAPRYGHVRAAWACLCAQAGRASWVSWVVCAHYTLEQFLDSVLFLSN